MADNEPTRSLPRGRHARVRRVRARLDALAATALDRRNRTAVCILIVALVVGATIGLLSLFGRSGGRQTALPPTPPSPVATFAPGTSLPSPPAPSSSSPPKAPQKPLHCSTPAPPGGSAAPFQICIPVLRVDASMMQLGLNKDRTVEVPPLSRVGDAGWYKYSAEPGATGPSVILGHVDSAQYGQGIFYRLGQLHSGDKVVVSRGDGMIATFRVDKVSEVPKKHFPTDAVYGATSGPAIRLVTCGGKFDAASGNYLDNIIAYGTLLSLHPR